MDLCQLVMDCLNHIEGLKPDTVSNYINTAMTHEIQRFLEKRSEIRSNEIQTLDTINGKSPLKEISPKTIAVGNVWVEDVIKFILDKKLISERDLYIILLSAGFVDGIEWTEPEIARHLGLPVGTVSSALSRKARELRTKLKNMLDER